MVAALAVMLARPPVAAGSAAVVAAGQPAGISVSGEGKLTMVPDLATVQLGVEARAQTVEDARQQAADAMDKVIAQLKAGGVAEDDIKTVQFNIAQDRRSVPNGPPVIDGYRVSNIVTAKIHSVSGIGRLIDDISRAGGNLVRVDRVEFGMNDPASFKARLRELAIADAKARAEQLARLSGKSLGDPTYIQESGGAPVPRPAAFQSLAADARAADTSINPGQTEVSLQLQVIYEIR